MLTTYTTGSATVPLIASCSFVFEVVGFIINDFKKKKKNPWIIQQNKKILNKKKNTNKKKKKKKKKI